MSSIHSPFFVFILSVCFSATSFAQADIRDSNSSSAAPIADVPVMANSSVVYDVQALQQEVLTLRGQLERVEHELQRLKRQRLDDYLDLDKRVSELSQQLQFSSLPAAPSTITPNTNTSPTPTPTPTPTPSTNVVPSVISPIIDVNGEQANQLYSEAIDLLLSKQDYTGAQTKFNEYLTTYPKGQYTPNVYYWQGQILFVSAKKEEAVNYFEKLLAEYPTHQKVPDGKFKLARIYFEQGKKDEAKVILDELVNSDTDVAILAKSFISKNYP